MPLPRLRPDLSPLRESRDLRLVILGNFLSTLGSQATLVALPYQLYVQTHSALLVGLLGAVELGPLMASALLAGAIADRMDRRRLLLLDQIGLVLSAGGLALAAFAGHPPIARPLRAGRDPGRLQLLENVTASAILPNLVAPERLRGALALNYGLYQLTMVVGPGLGGLVVALFGVQWAYSLDAGSCVAIVLAVRAIAPQPPRQVQAHDTIRRSIAEGLRYARGNRALLGSFAIDLVAMTFGMPRALFAVLSVSVYHAGAAGTGVLYSAVSAGATVAALTTGWLTHARRLGRVVVWAVVIWGAAIALAGVAGTLWLAAVLLAAAGAADSISAVSRTAIIQSLTPDHMRGRMASVYALVVTSGPRLGDIEAGAVAGAAGVRFSVISGGLACLAGVAVVLVAFPALVRYDAEQWTGAPAHSPA